MLRAVSSALAAGAAFSIFVFACGGSYTVIGSADASVADGPTEGGSEDPCAGKSLPQCPTRCEAFPMTGACSSGDRCAQSEIGDGCDCQGGSWTCSVHPPLGTGCNQVCRGLAPADAGVDAAIPDGGVCDPSAKEPCGALAYCKSTDCVTGVCTPRPAETSNAEVPVCGCDGITYWNDNVAAARGMSVKSSGACAAGVACGGPGPMKMCAAGFACNMQVNGAGGCAMQSAPGVCWALPSKCPTVGIGPNTRACGAPACQGTCDLIRDEATYYKDNTCPM